MNIKLLSQLIDVVRVEDKTILSKPNIVKKISSKSISYTERHRGSWFKPEYDLEEIQIAQDTDSYLFRSIKKKVNRFLTAGWEIVGNNKETVDYIKKRISEIEYVSSQPWNLLLTDTAVDLFRFSNCMWVKSRNVNSSSGKIRKIFGAREVEPVAGYFIMPFETLSFKTKRSGDIKKIRQKMPSGDFREFFPHEVVHFYDNKKPGFAMGTPEITPVLEDIALLRRIEENVEDLLESNLYPLFHYQVGSDSLPERYSPEGIKETDIVKSSIDYMPAGGIYVSDHRHKITAIGSEGRALRIEGYLDYFKKRVFAGLGVSSVDMGEGDTANSSTAHSLSKSAILDVEAMQKVMKSFIEFHIFNELLLEGGYDPLEQDDRVEIKFGVVDMEVRSKLENQTIQLFLNKLITETEARKRLGLPPEVDIEETHYKLYEEPLALLKMSGPNTAATEALVESERSSITREGAEKEKSSSVERESRGRKGEMAKQGASNLSTSISKPENQHGVRTSPKFTSDYVVLRLNAIQNIFDDILDKTKENYLVYSSVKEKYINILDNLLLDINNFEKNLKNNENVINNNDRIDSVFSPGLEEILELYEFKTLSLKKEFTND
jgi:hypothetical protein